MASVTIASVTVAVVVTTGRTMVARWPQSRTTRTRDGCHPRLFILFTLFPKRFQHVPEFVIAKVHLRCLIPSNGVEADPTNLATKVISEATI